MRLLVSDTPSRARRVAMSTKLLSMAMLTCLVLAACGATSNTSQSQDTASSSSESDTVTITPTLSVAVSMFPIEDIARNVGGERVSLVLLVEPGRAAHDAELTARQLDALSDADAVLYGGMGFQPEIEKAIDTLGGDAPRVDLFFAQGVTHLAADKSADSGADDDGHNHNHDHKAGAEDPHVWLDPANMIAMTHAVVATLSDLDPGAANTYVANGEAYIADLTALGQDIDTRFTNCATRTVVTSHDAFQYLATRATLKTTPIAGVNPEDEPSAKELESIAKAARAAGATTVFFEALLPENLARTVADAIDAEVAALDPLESISRADLGQGETYVSLMRRNLDVLAAGLRCS